MLLLILAHSAISFSQRFNQCLSTDCVQASVTGTDDYRLESVSLILTGPSNILEGPDLPASLAMWNAFTVAPAIAGFSASFISHDGNASIRFYGEVSSFYVVPESNTWTSLLIAIVTSIGIRPAYYGYSVILVAELSEH